MVQTRYWITPQDHNDSFGPDTVGLVDNNVGGIIAYLHKDNAERFLKVFSQN